jgi:hypothetical protein
MWYSELASGRHNRHRAAGVVSLLALDISTDRLVRLAYAVNNPCCSQNTDATHILHACPYAASGGFTATNIISPVLQSCCCGCSAAAATAAAAGGATATDVYCSLLWHATCCTCC